MFSQIVSNFHNSYDKSILTKHVGAIFCLAFSSVHPAVFAVACACSRSVRSVHVYRRPYSSKYLPCHLLSSTARYDRKLQAHHLLLYRPSAQANPIFLSVPGDQRVPFSHPDQIDRPYHYIGCISLLTSLGIDIVRTSRIERLSGSRFSSWSCASSLPCVFLRPPC